VKRSKDPARGGRSRFFPPESEKKADDDKDSAPRRQAQLFPPDSKKRADQADSGRRGAAGETSRPEGRGHVRGARHEGGSGGRGEGNVRFSGPAARRGDGGPGGGEEVVPAESKSRDRASGASSDGGGADGPAAHRGDGVPATEEPGRPEDGVARAGDGPKRDPDSRPKLPVDREGSNDDAGRAGWGGGSGSGRGGRRAAGEGRRSASIDGISPVGDDDAAGRRDGRAAGQEEPKEAGPIERPGKDDSSNSGSDSGDPDDRREVQEEKGSGEDRDSVGSSDSDSDSGGPAARQDRRGDTDSRTVPGRADSSDGQSGATQPEPSSYWTYFFRWRASNSVPSGSANKKQPDRRAESPAGRRAGSPAGRRASRAGRRAGSPAGRRAGSPAGSDNESPVARHAGRSAARPAASRSRSKSDENRDSKSASTDDARREGRGDNDGDSARSCDPEFMPEPEESEASFDPDKSELETQRKKMKGDLIHDMIMVLHGMNVVKTGGNNFFLSMFRIFLMLQDVMTKIITMDLDKFCPGEIPQRPPSDEFRELWRAYAKSGKDLKEMERKAQEEMDPREQPAIEATVFCARFYQFITNKSMLDASAGNYVPPVSTSFVKNLKPENILRMAEVSMMSPALRKDMEKFSEDLTWISDLERDACDLEEHVEERLDKLISIGRKEEFVSESDKEAMILSYEVMKADYLNSSLTAHVPDHISVEDFGQAIKSLKQYRRDMYAFQAIFLQQVQLLLDLCHAGISEMNGDIISIFMSHRHRLQRDLTKLRDVPHFDVSQVDNLVSSVILSVIEFQNSTRRLRDSYAQLSLKPGFDADNSDLLLEDGIDVHQFEWIASAPSLSEPEISKVLASYEVRMHAFSEENDLSTAMLQKMKSTGMHSKDRDTYMDGCKARMRLFREISKTLRILCLEGKIENSRFYDFFHDMISKLEGEIKECKRLRDKLFDAIPARECNIEEVKIIWQAMTTYPWPKDRTERPVV